MGMSARRKNKEEGVRCEVLGGWSWGVVRRVWRRAGAVGGRRLWRRGGRRAFVHNLVRNEKALIFTALRQI